MSMLPKKMRLRHFWEYAEVASPAGSLGSCRNIEASPNFLGCQLRWLPAFVAETQSVSHFSKIRLHLPPPLAVRDNSLQFACYVLRRAIVLDQFRHNSSPGNQI